MNQETGTGAPVAVLLGQDTFTGRPDDAALYAVAGGAVCQISAGDLSGHHAVSAAVSGALRFYLCRAGGNSAGQCLPNGMPFRSGGQYRLFPAGAGRILSGNQTL